MPLIVLNPMISSYTPMQNSSVMLRSESPLILSNRYNASGNHTNDLLVTFTAGTIDFSSSSIHHAQLELPVREVRPPNSDFTNTIIIKTYHRQDDISGVETTSWITQQLISMDSFSNGYLCLNLDELISHWDSTRTPTLELILSIESASLFIQLANPGIYLSKLSIQYTPKELPPSTHSLLADNAFLNNIPLINPLPIDVPNQTTPSRSAVPDSSIEKGSIRDILSIEATIYPSFLIPSEDSIPFNALLCNSTSNIKYDFVTRKLFFFAPGYYYVQWIINLQGSCTRGCIGIGIRNEATGELLDFHMPCVLPLQLCGQHILHITDYPLQYSLINSSDAAIQLSTAHSQASLITFKL